MGIALDSSERNPLDVPNQNVTGEKSIQCDMPPPRLTGLSRESPYFPFAPLNLLLMSMRIRAIVFSVSQTSGGTALRNSRRLTRYFQMLTSRAERVMKGPHQAMKDCLKVVQT